VNQTHCFDKELEAMGSAHLRLLKPENLSGSVDVDDAWEEGIRRELSAQRGEPWASSYLPSDCRWIVAADPGAATRYYGLGGVEWMP
jgi:hypothetical protein